MSLQDKLKRLSNDAYVAWLAEPGFSPCPDTRAAPVPQRRKDMPRKNYDAEAIDEECLIHPGRVAKVKGEDAFLIDMRVIGHVKIDGKGYTHNDVLTFKFTPDARYDED